MRDQYPDARTVHIQNGIFIKWKLLFVIQVVTEVATLPVHTI